MKDMLPNLRDLGSYQEVIEHLINSHGEEGKAIALDRNQAPFMWHEMVGHCEDVPDHDHYGDQDSNVESMTTLVKMIVEDPEVQEQFKKFFESEETQTAIRAFEKYRVENGQ